MYIDTTTRLVIAGAAFVFFALLETARPQRALELGRTTRWSGNLGVFATDLLLIGLPLQGLAFTVLIWAETHQVGIMNWLDMPFAVRALIGFLALDALFYFQHRLSHSLPVLWRLHRVHHADTEMDVSTANRVHPLESLWLTFLRVCLAIALGIPIVVIIVFQIALNIVSIFNHANLKIPDWLDRIIRWIIVTPNMHETHHSAHDADYDTNFSFIFSFWDRIFGTYKPETTTRNGKVVLGLDEFRGLHETDLLKLLSMPFRDSPKSRKLFQD